MVSMDLEAGIPASTGSETGADLHPFGATASLGRGVSPRRKSVRALRRRSSLLVRAGSVLKLFKERSAEDGEDESKGVDDGEDDEEEDSWQQHPVQKGCTVGNVERLSKACLDQLNNVSYFKKKKISGLREVEASLRRLIGKLDAEKVVLQRFQSTEEMKQPLNSLQDTLVLLSRKFSHVAKKRYFLDASYSKRMVALHQSLVASENEVFMTLSRKLMASALGDGRGALLARSSADHAISLGERKSGQIVKEFMHLEEESEEEEESVEDNLWNEEEKEEEEIGGNKEEEEEKPESRATAESVLNGDRYEDGQDGKGGDDESSRNMKHENQPKLLQNMSSSAMSLGSVVEIDEEGESDSSEPTSSGETQQDKNHDMLGSNSANSNNRHLSEDDLDSVLSRSSNKAEDRGKKELKELRQTAISLKHGQQDLLPVETLRQAVDTLAKDSLLERKTKQRRQSATREIWNKFLKRSSSKSETENQSTATMPEQVLKQGKRQNLNASASAETSKEDIDCPEDAKALYRMGKACLYSDGLDQDQDNRQAVVYLCRAAELGHVPAMLALGRLYEKGAGIDVADPYLVQNFYACAARMKDSAGMAALAAFNLANADQLVKGHDDGSSDLQHIITESLDMLRRAAVLGDPQANCVLGELYQHGNQKWNIEKNAGKAEALFALAAQQGFARAQNNLAVLLMQKPQSKKQGLGLLRVSAAKGYLKAINNLGMYYEGLLCVTDDCPDDTPVQNLPLALKHYAKAAAQGLPCATHNLARAFFTQSQTCRNKAERTRLLAKAEELFHSAASRGVVDAHYFLGLIQTMPGGPPGSSFAKDQSAIYHFMQVLQTPQIELADSAIFAQAGIRLGNSFYKHQQYQKAFTVYLMLAKNEQSAVAMNALGLMYESGRCSDSGVPEFAKAVAQYEEAHSLGHTEASLNLAVLHLKGAGVEKDVERSKQLLEYVQRMATTESTCKLASSILAKLALIC